MEGKSAAASGRTLSDLVADMAELLARAFFGGLAAAVAMSLAILALSANAQAATLNDAKTGELLLRTSTAGEYVVAPRVATEVAIEVSGMVARTRVTQHFHNPGSEHVEGVYVFPLPEKSAVDRLRIRIGARAIEGRIREIGEARKAYDAALSIDANYAYAHLNIAILYDLYLHDGNKALQHYQRYQALSPTEDTQVVKWIVDLQQRMKKTERRTSG